MTILICQSARSVCARKAARLVLPCAPSLLDHCLRSNGRLFYATADEFVEALDLLVAEPELGSALGANGRRYIEAGYRWPAVMERYRGLIEAVQAPA